MIEHFVLLSVVSCVQFLAPQNQRHGLYHLPHLPVTYLRAEHPGKTCRVDRLNDGDMGRKGDATECVRSGPVIPLDGTLEKSFILSLAHQRRTVPSPVFCWAFL